MKSEYFFTLYLTENEHYIVEDDFKNYCDKNGLTLLYYREFKTGHKPGHREIKIVGEKTKVNKFKKFLNENNYCPENEYRQFKEYIKKMKNDYEIRKTNS